jgi:hypothetical protein
VALGQGRLLALQKEHFDTALKMPIDDLLRRLGGFYIKNPKKYHAIFDGVKEGTKFGSIYTGCAAPFMVNKAIVDLSRR